MYLPFCSSFYVFVQKTDSQAVFVQEWITSLVVTMEEVGTYSPQSKIICIPFVLRCG